MSNTSTAVKAGLLTVAVFVASTMLLASSLKTTPAQTAYDAPALQHTASVSQPVEVVTVVATRRAS